MKGRSRRTLGGDSGNRTPSKGLLRDINLSSCFPMSSCIPLYLLDADDLHSSTALASLRYTEHSGAQVSLTVIDPRRMLSKSHSRKRHTFCNQ